MVNFSETLGRCNQPYEFRLLLICIADLGEQQRCTVLCRGDDASLKQNINQLSGKNRHLSFHDTAVRRYLTRSLVT